MTIRFTPIFFLAALLLVSLVHGAAPLNQAILRDMEGFYNMQPRMLIEIRSEESSDGANTLDHDGGLGCGDFGMKMETASRVLGSPVSCVMLQDPLFAAWLAARYLTEPAFCGRYRTWTIRVLCYRTGENSDAVARWKHRHWRALPKDFATRWIMARIAHTTQDAYNRAVLEAGRLSRL